MINSTIEDYIQLNLILPIATMFIVERVKQDQTACSCFAQSAALVSLISVNETLYRGYLFLFSVKDRNLDQIHRVDTIGIIFTSGCATRENITDCVHEMK